MGLIVANNEGFYKNTSKLIWNENKKVHNANVDSHLFYQNNLKIYFSTYGPNDFGSGSGLLRSNVYYCKK